MKKNFYISKKNFSEEYIELPMSVHIIDSDSDIYIKVLEKEYIKIEISTMDEYSISIQNHNGFIPLEWVENKVDSFDNAIDILYDRLGFGNIIHEHLTIKQ